MRGLVALVVLAAAIGPAVSAHATPGKCQVDHLVDGHTAAAPMSLLDVALAASVAWDQPPSRLPDDKKKEWAKIRTDALAEVAKCQGLESPRQDNYARQLRSVWKDRGWEQGIVKATRAEQPTDPVLAPLLAPGGGVPSPQRLQLGLSQVVTGGEPGMLASATGAITANSPTDYWKRHTSLSLSALVIQPSGGSGSSTTSGSGAARSPDPQVGAIDLGVLYSSKPTIYDWTNCMTKSQAVKDAEDDFADAAWNITDQFLASFHDAVESGTSYPAALAGSASLSGRAYFDNTDAALRDRIKRCVTRPAHRDFALHLRVSQNATYVPELPDLTSLQLSWSGDAGQERKTDSTFWRFTWSVDAAVSAFPTQQYASLTSWNDFRNTLGMVADAAVGGAACLPSGNQTSPTRVDFAAVGRWSKHAKDQQDSGLLSAGGHISISLPIGSGISLVGGYTFRYQEAGRGWITTTSLTLAKSLGGA